MTRIRQPACPLRPGSATQSLTAPLSSEFASFLFRSSEQMRKLCSSSDWLAFRALQAQQVRLRLKFAVRWGFPNCVTMFGLRHWRSPKETAYAALRTASMGSAASMPFGKVPAMNNRLLSAVA